MGLDKDTILRQLEVSFVQQFIDKLKGIENPKVDCPAKVFDDLSAYRWSAYGWYGWVKINGQEVGAIIDVPKKDVELSIDERNDFARRLSETVNRWFEEAWIWDGVSGLIKDEILDKIVQLLVRSFQRKFEQEVILPDENARTKVEYSAPPGRIGWRVHVVAHGHEYGMSIDLKESLLPMSLREKNDYIFTIQRAVHAYVTGEAVSADL